MGYKAYKLKSRENLSNPFLAMYFGAAYVCWLTNYSGRYQAAPALSFIELPSSFYSLSKMLNVRVTGREQTSSCCGPTMQVPVAWMSQQPGFSTRSIWPSVNKLQQHLQQKPHQQLQQKL